MAGVVSLLFSLNFGVVSSRCVLKQFRHLKKYIAVYLVLKFKIEWSNERVLEFLDLYENEPVIWNTKHSEHKNRNVFNDAWKKNEGTVLGVP